MEGFIGLYREITKWEWYDDGNTFRLFVHLVLLANHTAKNWHGHNVNRGQLITGRKRLAKDLKLTERKIRTALCHLETTNEITIEPTSHFSRITITNYDTYNPLNEKRASKPTKETTNEQPTTDQQPTTTKNVENEKNKEEVINAPKSSKRKKGKPTGVRDNPPTKHETCVFCDEQGFKPDWIDPDELWDFYVTDKADNLKWTYKDGKDVMNWKSLYRNIHNSNRKQGKKVNATPTTSTGRLSEGQEGYHKQKPL